MSEKITAIVEEVKALSVLELSELVKALEETFGVSAAAMAAPAAGAAAAEPVEEKTEFDVVLAGLSDPKAKIKVIKVVREVTGLGLADAKAAVENAPTTLKEAAAKEDADSIKEKVEAAGGKVELK
jgi:large subunit ribosomal protein L7/L12